jgi:hypothetical protein
MQFKSIVLIQGEQRIELPEKSIHRFPVLAVRIKSIERCPEMLIHFAEDVLDRALHIRDTRAVVFPCAVLRAHVQSRAIDLGDRMYADRSLDDQATRLPSLGQAIRPSFG